MSHPTAPVTTTWVGHSTSLVILAASALGLATAGWGVWRADQVAVIVGCVAAAICALMSRTTVRIDGRGVTVLFSWLRWPRTVVSLDHIISFGATELSWRTWKGWGYRKSRLLGGDTAVIMRSGEGVRVDTDQRSLSISVDDAAGAVDALSELLHRRPDDPTGLG